MARGIWVWPEAEMGGELGWFPGAVCGRGGDPPLQ